MQEPAEIIEDPLVAKDRRLRKATKLVETLKEKYRFEKEVSGELARRNESLRAEIENERYKFELLMGSFLEMDEIAFTCIDSDVCTFFRASSLSRS